MKQRRQDNNSRIVAGGRNFKTVAMTMLFSHIYKRKIIKPMSGSGVAWVLCFLAN